jgi:hypothetical protein
VKCVENRRVSVSKTQFAAVLVTVGLSFGMAGTANAAPQAAAGATPNGISAQAVWFTYGYYWVLADCEYTGRYLVSTGTYKAWNCTPYSTGSGVKYELRVLD